MTFYSLYQCHTWSMMKQFDLKKWRIKHGLTQEELSKLILFTPRTISAIENGYAPKRMDLIESFCNSIDEEMGIK